MLKQFDDLLVKILIVAAIVSFFLALVNGETGFTAFVEPAVSINPISSKNLLLSCLVHLVLYQPETCEKGCVIFHLT